MLNPICVFVLQCIYEFIFHSSMDQILLIFVLLIFFSTLHYFRWNDVAHRKLVDLLLQKLPVII